MANLLKTAVSVLASTVRLTVSFIEPLMTVSVMLRCSLPDVSSPSFDLLQSPTEGVGGGNATLVPSQPSASEEREEKLHQESQHISRNQDNATQVHL